MNGFKNNFPDTTVIKGLLATIFGFMFIILSYNIIIKMVLFLSGLFLLWYGFQLLNVSALNNFCRVIKENVKKMFS